MSSLQYELTRDPLLVARDTHVGKYLGSPDGLTCMGCTTDHLHVALRDCAVINDNRCEYEFGEHRCILSDGHEGDSHLVESPFQQRMRVWEDA